ncbi:MAG: TlyA family rRNA (cytidine-2'-O)-methyltransferase [bacterium]|nr:TlyA family rRNA (cytidine-2'-O)-methyltransferase [bacterium]
MPYVSRGGDKLACALDAFGIDPAGLVCADLGCSTGGFTDVLLQRGALRVHAVDTAYGVLDWRLRSDPRVAVHERTNALRVELPEPVALVVIDAGWTRQQRVVPRALALLEPGGSVVSLIKPHYEAPPSRLVEGRLPPEEAERVLEEVLGSLRALARIVAGPVVSPVDGGKAGNREYLVHLAARDPAAPD